MRDRQEKRRSPLPLLPPSSIRNEVRIGTRIG